MIVEVCEFHNMFFWPRPFELSFRPPDEVYEVDKNNCDNDSILDTISMIELKGWDWAQFLNADKGIFYNVSRKG